MSHTTGLFPFLPLFLSITLYLHLFFWSKLYRSPPLNEDSIRIILIFLIVRYLHFSSTPVIVLISFLWFSLFFIKILNFSSQLVNNFLQQLVDFLSNMLNVHDESWQLGTTKLFIKSLMNEKLDRLLWVRYSSSSRRIQVPYCTVLDCTILYYTAMLKYADQHKICLYCNTVLNHSSLISSYFISFTFSFFLFLPLFFCLFLLVLFLSLSLSLSLLLFLFLISHSSLSHLSSA